MATKTVALDIEAYELLRRQKRSEESFSDAVKRLARPRKPISAFAGMWANTSPKQRRDLEELRANMRKVDRRKEDKIRRAWHES
jgi:predicted CopG family antitoxin